MITVCVPGTTRYVTLRTKTVILTAALLGPESDLRAGGPDVGHVTDREYPPLPI